MQIIFKRGEDHIPTNELFFIYEKYQNMFYNGCIAFKKKRMKHEWKANQERALRLSPMIALNSFFFFTKCSTPSPFLLKKTKRTSVSFPLYARKKQRLNSPSCLKKKPAFHYCLCFLHPWSPSPKPIEPICSSFHSPFAWKILDVLKNPNQFFFLFVFRNLLLIEM